MAPNSYTDREEYFEVAEWMSCSMCGEAIEIMREIGKLADPGLVPYIFFRDMRDWFCQWQVAKDERWKGTYAGPDGSTVSPVGTKMGACTGPRNCEKIGHAASAEIRERSMRAIRARFGGAAWFTTIMGICERRATLWGRKDDGFPFYLRNLQDDLVAVALGPEIAGCLSESIDGWCADREVPISVKEGCRLAPAQEARGIGGLFLAREGRVEPLRKSLDLFGKEAVALLEGRACEEKVTFDRADSFVGLFGWIARFLHEGAVHTFYTRRWKHQLPNVRRDAKGCWTFRLLRRSSGRYAK